MRPGFILLAILLAVWPAWGQQQSSIPQDGVLLLRNGSVLQGRIARSDDRYVVLLESGELRVQARDVEVVCRDLQEVYMFKRGGLRNPRADDHLSLAEWCLKQKMHDAAAAELHCASQLEHNHARLAGLQFRLEQELTTFKPEPGESRPRGQPLSNLELDRMIKSLPPGTVETFTTSIQPLLLHSCATAACHSPHSGQSFALLRVPVGRGVTRGLTQRNLHEVLELINRDNPAESRLLAIPLQEHAGRQPPSWGEPASAPYRQLVAWVYGVSGSKPPSEEAGASSAYAPIIQTLHNETLELPSARPTLQTSGNSISPGSSVSVDQSGSRQPQTISLSPPRQDAHVPVRPQNGFTASSIRKPEADYVPRDPFDPEIFNRRYHPAEE